MGNGVLFVTVISTGKEAERSQRKRSYADDHKGHNITRCKQGCLMSCKQGYRHVRGWGCQRVRREHVRLLEAIQHPIRITL